VKAKGRTFLFISTFLLHLSLSLPPFLSFVRCLINPLHLPSCSFSPHPGQGPLGFEVEDKEQVICLFELLSLKTICVALVQPDAGISVLFMNPQQQKVA
jgi:hypothetical protein